MYQGIGALVKKVPTSAGEKRNFSFRRNVSDRSGSAHIPWAKYTHAKSSASRRISGFSLKTFSAAYPIRPSQKTLGKRGVAPYYTLDGTLHDRMARRRGGDQPHLRPGQRPAPPEP